MNILDFTTNHEANRRLSTIVSANLYLAQE
jgi:hypothetical protein